MTVLIANDAVLSFLGQVRDKAEIRTAEGKLLGNFEPHVETEDEMYERINKLFDPEELARAKAKGMNGSSFEEMMKRIQALGETK